MNSLSIAKLFGPLTMSSLSIGKEVIKTVNVYLPKDHHLTDSATGFIVEAVIHSIDQSDLDELLQVKIESEDNRVELQEHIAKAMSNLGEIESDDTDHTDVVERKERKWNPYILLIFAVFLLMVSIGIVSTYIGATTTAQETTVLKFIWKIVKFLLKLNEPSEEG